MAGVDVALSVGSGFGGLPVRHDPLAAAGAEPGERVMEAGGSTPYASLPSADRRVVITGVGVVAPNGVGTEAWWKATQAGENGIGPITRFDTSKYAAQLAGEVDGFDPEDVHREAPDGPDRPLDLDGARRRPRWRSADAGFDPAAARARTRWA